MIKRVGLCLFALGIAGVLVSTGYAKENSSVEAPVTGNVEMILEQENAEEAFLDKAKKKAASVYSGAKAKGGDVYSTAKEYVAEKGAPLIDAAEDKAADVYNAARDYLKKNADGIESPENTPAASLLDKAKKTAVSAYETVKEKGAPLCSSASEYVTEKSGSVYDSAKDFVTEKSGGIYNAAIGKVKDLVEEHRK